MELFKMFGEVALKGAEAVASKLQLVGQTAEQVNDKMESIRDYVQVRVDANTQQAKDNIDDVQEELRELPREKEVEVRADTNQFMAAIATIGPAIAPVLASVGALAGGLVATFGAAGAGVAAFAAVAIPSLNGVFEASEEVSKIQKKIAEADTAKERKEAMKELEAVMTSLTGKEREALKALQDFKKFWSSFVGQFKNPVLDLFIRSLGTLKTVLTQLKPVFETSISAFTSLFNGIDNAVKSNQMKPFFDWLAVSAGPALTNFGTIFGNIFKGITNLMMAFGPVSTDMQSGLVGLTQKFADWTAGLSKSQGFKDFINYVKANGPTLMSIIGQIATLFGHLIIALAPFGPIVLQVIDSILRFTNYILGLSPAFNTVLVGIGMIVGVFALLVGPVTSAIALFGRMKTAVSTVGPFFTRLGNAIKPIGTTIMTALRTGFTWLITAFRTMGAAIGRFVSGLIPRLVSGFMGFLRILNVVRLFLFTNPLGLIITAITAVVAAGIWLYQNWSIVKGQLIAIWSAIKTAGTAAWNFLKNAVVNAARFLYNGVRSAFASLRSNAISIWNSIRSAVVNTARSLYNSARATFNSLRSTVVSIWQSIRSAASSAWSSIRSTITNGIRSAYNTVKGYASNFLTAGKSLMSSLAKGISNGISKAISAVKSGMATIRSYLPFSPAKEGPLSDLDKSGESFFPTFASRMKQGLSPALQSVGAGLGQMLPNANKSVVAANTGTNISNHFTINVDGNTLQNSNLNQLADQLVDLISVKIVQKQQRQARGLS